MTDSFNARTEIGLATNPPTGECCTPAPNVLEYDAAGALVGHWGGPGAGYDWPAQNAGLAVDDAGNVWIGGAGGTGHAHPASSRATASSSPQFGKAGAPASRRRSGGAAPDTAYAGVSPGRGAAVAAARPRRRGRGGPPPLPPNSTSMDTFGGRGGFRVRHEGQRSLRRRRLPQPSRRRDRHDHGRDQAHLGRVRQQAGRRRRSDVLAERHAAEAVRHPVRCAKLSNDGLVYVCDAQNDRIQVFKKDGSFVKEKTVAPHDARHRLGVGRRVLARPAAEISLRRRRA